MIVGDVSDLTIAAVLDRGVANKECIAIKAINPVQLGQYGLMIANFVAGSGTFPYRDHLFWFGEAYIKQGDWLFVHTGSGEPKKSTSSEANDLYSLYWGRPTTVFAQSHVVPVLFRVDAADILSPPMDQPQIALPPSQ